MNPVKQERIVAAIKFGKYFSDLNGSVFSKADRHGGLCSTARKLKPAVARNGYKLITIVDLRGAVLTCGVHQFVSIFFFGQYASKLEVNHINGNKLDNRIKNLELLSRSDNQKHSYKIGLRNQDGGKNPSAKLSEKQVKQIRKLSLAGLSYLGLAEKFNVTKGNVHCIVKRKTWRHI